MSMGIFIEGLRISPSTGICPGYEHLKKSQNHGSWLNTPVGILLGFCQSWARLGKAGKDQWESEAGDSGSPTVNPCSKAKRINWERFSRLSLPKILVRWVCTVRGLI